MEGGAMSQHQQIDPTEHRGNPRHAANLVVFFWPAAPEESRQGPGDTTDVSHGGMFVVTPKPPPRRTLLFVEAFLDTSDDPPIRAWARVQWRRRWRRPRGMGLQLVRISADDRQRLDAWLAKVGADGGGDRDVA